MTTKLFPLSAFMTILVGSSFKFFKAFLSVVLIFLCCGRRARSRMHEHCQHSRIVMKADKGNSLVVMDRSDYGSKMTNLLQDNTTYTVARKAPFKKVERELNAMLFDLKNQGKLPDKTYRKLHSSDAIPPSIKGSIKHHKVNHPLRPIVTSIDSALYNTSKFLSRILSPL